MNLLDERVAHLDNFVVMLQKRGDFLAHDSERSLNGESINARRNERERDRPGVELHRAREGAAVATAQQLFLVGSPAAPDGPHGMHAPARRQVERGRRHGISRRAPSDSLACRAHLVEPRSREQRSTYAAARRQAHVCGIHQNICVHARDVIANNRKRHDRPPST